jgi:hypothetical protein
VTGASALARHPGQAGRAAGVPVGHGRQGGLSTLRALALKRFVALAGILGLACYAGICASRPTLAPVSSDGFSYDVYLPS